MALTVLVPEGGFETIALDLLDDPGAQAARACLRPNLKGHVDADGCKRFLTQVASIAAKDARRSDPAPHAI
jgi:hypothetical protein